MFNSLFCHIRIATIHVRYEIVLINTQVGFDIYILYLANALYKMIKYKNSAHVLHEYNKYNTIPFMCSPSKSHVGVY